MSGPAAVPLHRRWWYAGFLTVGLLTGFAQANRHMHGVPLPAVHVPVLGFVVVAVGALLWLRPQPVYYAGGLACLLVAFVAFWVASPDGGRWAATYLLQDPGYGPYGGRWAGPLWLLFPVAWLLLASSAAGWQVAVGSYGLAWAAFLVMALVGLGPAALVQMPAALLSVPLLWLSPFLWPAYTLMMLGVFGHTVG